MIENILATVWNSPSTIKMMLISLKVGKGWAASVKPVL